MTWQYFTWYQSTGTRTSTVPYMSHVAETSIRDGRQTPSCSGYLRVELVSRKNGGKPEKTLLCHRRRNSHIFDNSYFLHHAIKINENPPRTIKINQKYHSRITQHLRCFSNLDNLYHKMFEHMISDNNL